MNELQPIPRNSIPTSGLPLNTIDVTPAAMSSEPTRTRGDPSRAGHLCSRIEFPRAPMSLIHRRSLLALLLCSVTCVNPEKPRTRAAADNTSSSE